MKTYRITTPDNEYVEVQAYGWSIDETGLIVFVGPDNSIWKILNPAPGTLVEIVI